MATDHAHTTQAQTREESYEERAARLDLERKLLARARHTTRSESGWSRSWAATSTAGATPKVRRCRTTNAPLFRYAAATTKAVAMALQGTRYVTTNEGFHTDFTTEEAATVLCELSALLDEGPSLVESVRDAAGGESERGEGAPAESVAETFEEPAGLAEQERGALEAVAALRRAIDTFSREAEGLDYDGSAQNCSELARVAQLAATRLAQTAACYTMARTIADGRRSEVVR